jgi:type IV pilus assembly protein PilE
MNTRHQSGFSLIELLIALGIVGLLASLAYPAFTASVAKGKRAEARVALTELLQQQERYMTQRNCYVRFSSNTATGATTPLANVPNTVCGGGTPASAPFKGFSSDSINNAAYILSADNCLDGAGAAISIAECVLLTATPRKPDPDVGSLTLTSTGTKSCTGTKPLLCWK